MNKSYVQRQADKLQLDKMDVVAINLVGYDRTNWMNISPQLANHIMNLINQEYKDREEQEKDEQND